MDNSETATIHVELPKDELVVYAKNPCLTNWKRLLNTDAKNSICDRCPFRDSMRRFITGNPDRFSGEQVSLARSVESRWGPMR